MKKNKKTESSRKGGKSHRGNVRPGLAKQKAKDCINTAKQDLESYYVYDYMPYFQVDLNAVPTAATIERADEIFDRLGIGGRKLAEKRRYCQSFIHAAKIAVHYYGCLGVDRDTHKTANIHLQVIQALVDHGYFRECRSKPGRGKKSRYVPLATLHAITERDPWAHDPEEKEKALVCLRDRKTKEELPVDDSHPLVVDYTRRLQCVNDLISRYVVTAEWWDERNDEYNWERRLRPVLFASFSDNFDLHGRIYNRNFGHQSLRKRERKTIKFDGIASVELDFGGLHTRMLYHKLGIDYPGDPYALWPTTTPELRLLCKLALNITINSKSRKKALQSCENLASDYEWSKAKGQTGSRLKKKTGKDLITAQDCRQALKMANTTWKKVLARIHRKHKPIFEHFYSDSGIRLMREDGEMALEIMYRLAQQGIPALGVHDSFVVPEPHADALKEVMIECYKERYTYCPEIK